MTHDRPENKKILESLLTDDEFVSEGELTEEGQQLLAQDPSLQHEAQELIGDQQALRRYFASIEIPKTPTLELPGGLESASGYPRRISLTLIPLFLCLILLIMLMHDHI